MDAIPLGTTSPSPAPPQPYDGARPWLRHYSPGVPKSIQPPEHPLTWLLDEAARNHATATATQYYGATLTYGQLSTLASRFARALLALGVQRGDRVALSLPNIPQYPIAFYGILRAGGIVVPCNPLYTAPELEHQLNDSGARVIVTLGMFYATLASVRDRTPIEHVIIGSAAEYLPPTLSLLYRLRERMQQRGKPNPAADALRSDSTVRRFRDVVRDNAAQSDSSAPQLPEPAAPHDVAVLQYTGGTTGVAKGAMLTHRNLLVNAMQAWSWNEQPPDSHHVCLCVAPFFHSYGLTVGMNLTMLNASTMVLLPRFDVKDTLRAIKRYKPDLFPGIPTIYLALSREAERTHADLSSIKICISGSAPLPLEVQRRFEQDSGAKVVEGYGLTETSPVSHCNPVFGERRLGTIGLPLPGTDSAIVDPDTWDFLPPGQQGEIVIRGPQVMAGYWNRPDETAKVLHDGWLRTGDIGIMDTDGYFSIVDRIKDIIIAGGLKIFPREVDEAMFENPKVLEAAAVGVPDEYRGETVRAYVVVKPGETLTEDELQSFLKERLAPYKVPKQYEFRGSLPKSLVGKVLRRTLRDEYLARAQSSPSVTPTPPSPTT